MKGFFENFKIKVIDQEEKENISPYAIETQAVQ